MNSSLSTTAKSAAHKVVAAALLLSLAALLAGCERPLQRPRTDLDLRITLPSTWEVDRADQLDTDGDGEPEWVICYDFDVPGNRAFVPIRCAIYDIARREPKLPIVYPYHLQAPGWTYLGEGSGQVSVTLEDIVTPSRSPSDPETLEVVVTSKDANGYINRASIYRWHDSVSPELRKRTDPSETLYIPNQSRSSGEWYECLGMFESTLEVRLELDKVTVVDNVWENHQSTDRSQFARVNIYQPDSAMGGYLDENQNLIAPTSTCIDFAYGMPTDVADSPYPEKIVMAFLKTFMNEPDYGASLLTANAKSARQAGTAHWDYFSPATSETCIQIVGYGPSAETKAEVKAFDSAEVKIQSDIKAQVDTQAVHTVIGQTYRQEIKAKWTLVREDQELWKIDNVSIQGTRELH